MDLSRDFVEGAFFAICQRPATNTEMASILRNAKGDRRKAIFVIKSMPEANPFFNHFFNLSFNWLDSLLLIGEAPSPFQSDILVEDGVNCFVDVSGDDNEYSKYLPDGISYNRVPMVNDDYNGPDPFERVARAVLSFLDDNRRVYLHCKSGVSRSAAASAIIIGVQEDLPYHRAIERVRDRRPVACPHHELLTMLEADELIRRLHGELYSQSGSPPSKEGS